MRSSSQNRDIYPETFLDRLTFRRRISVMTALTEQALVRALVEMSMPPPTDGNPLHVTTPIAVSNSGIPVVFEINLARGLPFGEGHYVSFKVLGRITTYEDGGDARYRIRGEIVPTWQGILIYLGVLVVLLLWVAGTVTSAAISPLNAYMGVWVSLGTTLLLCGYMILLQWRDMRRLAAIIRTLKQ